MTSEPDGPPPFFRSWNRLYTAIIIYLAAIITLFAIFTRSYNR